MWTANDIPALPIAHGRAISMLAQRDVEIADLAAVIESDSALTAATLRAANSAISSPAHWIGTAREAVVRMGLETTLNIVSGTVVNGVFGELQRAGLDVGELWRHVIGTALLADAAASAAGARTEAFTTGLLHDVGRLSMAAQAPGEYAGVIKRVRAGTDPLAAELQTFGFSHVQWGERVAHAWGMPEDVVDGIASHHGEADGILARAVREARRAVASLGIGDGVAAPRPVDPEAAPVELVSTLGGPEPVLLLIDWYSGAFAVAA